MAESPAHKWGQIIGELFEETLRQELQKFANDHQLYLDYKRARKARPGKKVTWLDKFDNKHDLDYVFVFPFGDSCYRYQVFGSASHADFPALGSTVRPHLS